MRHTYYIHECMVCLHIVRSSRLILYNGCPNCGSTLVRVIHAEDCSGDEEERPLINRREEE